MNSESLPQKQLVNHSSDYKQIWKFKILEKDRDKYRKV